MEILNIGKYDDDTTTKGAHACRRCCQTGRFITGTLNGKPTGPGGSCFRCGGKGYHTLNDRRRNASYDRHAVNAAIRADFEASDRYTKRGSLDGLI